jgi:hypothetical protein
MIILAAQFALDLAVVGVLQAYFLYNENSIVTR